MLTVVPVFMLLVFTLAVYMLLIYVVLSCHTLCPALHIYHISEPRDFVLAH